MKFYRFFTALLIFTAADLFSQGFNVKASGMQTFNFTDPTGRNQVSFFSTTPIEDVRGTSNDVSGSVSFDVNDFANTLDGEIKISVASLNTGIEMRNQHLQGPNWLDAGNFPFITFKIKSVSNVKIVADNRLTCAVTGDFTLHGVTKQVTAAANVTYLDESEMTQKRAPGDLLGVRAEFDVKLSDFNVDNQIIGNKVADDIEVTVNIVGSNK